MQYFRWAGQKVKVWEKSCRVELFQSRLQSAAVRAQWERMVLNLKKLDRIKKIVIFLQKYHLLWTINLILFFIAKMKFKKRTKNRHMFHSGEKM
jgi:hypothetical protein